MVPVATFSALTKAGSRSAAVIPRSFPSTTPKLSCAAAAFHPRQSSTPPHPIAVAFHLPILLLHAPPLSIAGRTEPLGGGGEGMSGAWGGTTQKCSSCGRTVYPVEELTADGRAYHRPCFRCHHCKSTLQVFPPPRLARLILRGSP
jgi:hypothetical protein